TLIGLLTRVTVNVPPTRVFEIDVTVNVPAPPSCPLSQFCAPSTMVTMPPPLNGTATVITRKFVSCPVMVRMLLSSVARRDNELVHCTPSMSTLIVLPLLGVPGGGDVPLSVPLEVPSE